MIPNSQVQAAPCASVRVHGIMFHSLCSLDRPKLSLSCEARRGMKEVNRRNVRWCCTFQTSRERTRAGTPRPSPQSIRPMPDPTPVTACQRQLNANRTKTGAKGLQVRQSSLKPVQMDLVGRFRRSPTDAPLVRCLLVSPSKPGTHLYITAEGNNSLPLDVGNQLGSAPQFTQ
jgi:hypothetical protein